MPIRCNEAVRREDNTVAAYCRSCMAIETVDPGDDVPLPDGEVVRQVFPRAYVSVGNQVDCAQATAGGSSLGPETASSSPLPGPNTASPDGHVPAVNKRTARMVEEIQRLSDILDQYINAGLKLPLKSHLAAEWENINPSSDRTAATIGNYLYSTPQLCQKYDDEEAAMKQWLATRLNQYDQMPGPRVTRTQLLDDLVAAYQYPEGFDVDLYRRSASMFIEQFMKTTGRQKWWNELAQGPADDNKEGFH